MALLIEGFEGGNFGLLGNSSGNCSIANASSMFLPNAVPPEMGSYCAYMNGWNCEMNVNITEYDADVKEIYVKFRYQKISGTWGDQASYAPSIRGLNGSYICFLNIRSALLIFTVGSTTYTAPMRLCSARWYVIELHVVVSTDNETADGQFALYVNGIQQLGYSDVITSSLDADNSYVMSLCWSKSYDNAYYVDDVVVGTSTEYTTGSSHIVSFSPSGDSTTFDQWTSSLGGDKYLAVCTKGAESTVDATYDFTDDNSYKQAFTITEDGDNDYTYINTVQGVFRCCRGIGTPTLRTYLDLNATSSYGTDRVVPSSFGPLINFWPYEPGTTTPWTKTDLESAGFNIGMEAEF